MDGFGDDNFGDVDPAAEFLAREQQDLAGLDDDLKPVTSAPISLDGFGSHGDDSPPNGGFEVVSNGEPMFDDDVMANNDIQDNIFVKSDEESIFYSDMAAKPNVTPVVANDPPKPPAPQIKAPREEPEKIRLWREDQKKRLEEKDLNEEKKKEEWREASKRELEEWYRHHEDLIAKTKAANRELALNAEKEQVAEDAEIIPGTEWERIAKLCDFNPKASKASNDVSRMRSIILQLKQNPLPPKA